MKKVLVKNVYRYSIVCFIVLLSCNKKQEFKKSMIENISFDSPKSFIIKKENSEDSIVYSITVGNKIIGYIYYGDYKAFEETSYFITEEKELFEKFKNRELKAYLSKNMDRDYRNGIFNDNYYYYDTINKNIAQVMLPKKPKRGLIGIYFDSVDVHKNKFAIVSNNLSEENKKVFLEIFKTIKINH